MSFAASPVRPMKLVNSVTTRASRFSSRSFSMADDGGTSRFAPRRRTEQSEVW